jgi:hypothetical protein
MGEYCVERDNEVPMLSGISLEVIFVFSLFLMQIKENLGAGVLKCKNFL